MLDQSPQAKSVIFGVLKLAIINCKNITSEARATGA